MKHGRPLEIPARLVRTAGTCVGVIGLAATTGCINDLLNVETPTSVLADSLTGPASVPLLVAGAVADFECALGAHIYVTGLLTDELMDTQLQGAESFNYDRRTVSPAGKEYATQPCDFFGGIYQPISTARWSADNALKQLDAYSDAEITGRTALIAKAAAYSAYSLVLLGEAFCTAAIDAGPELTSAQVLALAETKFTRAIDAATTAGTTDIRNMALVGRARARRDLKKTAEAVQDAQSVPAGFVKNATYSAAASRAFNRVYQMNVRDLRVSIDAPFRGVTYQGTPDPRVPVVNSGVQSGDGGQYTVWITTKYKSLSDPIPIARWAEVQLIIAEALGGQTAVNIINALHAAAGLPSFSSSDPVEIANQVLEERRRELFLEGQHLFDTILYNLPLIPPPGTSYGFKGGSYGSTRCMPLPDAERDNNPTLSGR
ncbi:MAG: RagB/SusD family nutrient uptake outer membrane protein [Gemmatimonadetes bacterium]|nr:RagB/SusD family nutrient uptake outer membrane protein [Gemmatimonadota bacterium]